MQKHSASGFDSSLLTILASTGIFGGAVWLFMYLHLGFIHWRRFWKNSDPDSLAIIAIIAMLMIHAVFVNSLFFPFILVIFLSLSSLSSNINEK